MKTKTYTAQAVDSPPQTEAWVVAQASARKFERELAEAICMKALMEAEVLYVVIVNQNANRKF